MPKIIATKQDWISLGYKLFSQEGFKGLVVEKMALKLKVNKSSFYWHFKTKKDFLDEIVKFWVTSDTGKIISSISDMFAAKEKFEKLIELAFKKEPYLDFIFYLKRYALKDKNIQSIIDETDKQRINFTKTILLEMGFSKKEASIKSILFYKYLIGYHEMLRYKEQSKNYTKEVKSELIQFIKF